jgi:hypothetical protein
MGEEKKEEKIISTILLMKIKFKKKIYLKFKLELWIFLYSQIAHNFSQKFIPLMILFKF